MNFTRALVIEDEPDIRQPLCRHLLRLGVSEVEEAGTAAAGIEAFRRSSFGIVILDLGLPDGDGMDLIPKILTVDPDVRIICLTGRDDARSAVRALNAGASMYLAKPWPREELELFVRRAVTELESRRQLEIARRTSPSGGRWIPGASSAWLDALDLAKAAAAHGKATVLIRGESGSGKEVIAQYIHAESPRAERPFVATNVASIPSGLLEAELLGHEAGAFTGAQGVRRGLLELAHGGTLFLDEIGEMPIELQARLLRVLEGQPSFRTCACRKRREWRSYCMPGNGGRISRSWS